MNSRILAMLAIFLIFAMSAAVYGVTQTITGIDKQSIECNKQNKGKTFYNSDCNNCECVEKGIISKTYTWECPNIINRQCALKYLASNPEEITCMDGVCTDQYGNVVDISSMTAANQNYAIDGVSIKSFQVCSQNQLYNFKCSGNTLYECSLIQGGYYWFPDGSYDQLYECQQTCEQKAKESPSSLYESLGKCLTPLTHEANSGTIATDAIQGTLYTDIDGNVWKCYSDNCEQSQDSTNFVYLCNNKDTGKLTCTDSRASCEQAEYLDMWISSDSLECKIQLERKQTTAIAVQQETELSTEMSDCLAGGACYVADDGEYCWFDNEKVSGYIQCSDESDCADKMNVCINGEYDEKAELQTCLYGGAACYVADDGDYCWFDNSQAELGTSYTICYGENDCNNKFDVCMNYGSEDTGFVVTGAVTQTGIKCEKNINGLYKLEFVASFGFQTKYYENEIDCQKDCSSAATNTIPCLTPYSASSAYTNTNEKITMEKSSNYVSCSVCDKTDIIRDEYTCMGCNNNFINKFDCSSCIYTSSWFCSKCSQKFDKKITSSTTKTVTKQTAKAKKVKTDGTIKSSDSCLSICNSKGFTIGLCKGQPSVDWIAETSGDIYCNELYKCYCYNSNQIEQKTTVSVISEPIVNNYKVDALKTCDENCKGIMGYTGGQCAADAPSNEYIPLYSSGTQFQANDCNKEDGFWSFWFSGSKKQYCYCKTGSSSETTSTQMTAEECIAAHGDSASCYQLYPTEGWDRYNQRTGQQATTTTTSGTEPATTYENWYVCGRATINQITDLVCKKDSCYPLTEITEPVIDEYTCNQRKDTLLGCIDNTAMACRLKSDCNWMLSILRGGYCTAIPSQTYDINQIVSQNQEPLTEIISWEDSANEWWYLCQNDYSGSYYCAMDCYGDPKIGSYSSESDCQSAASEYYYP